MDGRYRYTDGSDAGQWSNAGSDAQQWTIETVGNYVMLKNRASGLYLDGMYRSTNGSVAGQYSLSGSDAQQWTRETTGSYVKFRNKATGLYLDGMGRTANGSDLGQWSQSNSNNQQWGMATVGQSRIATVVNDELLVSPNPFKSTFNLMVDQPGEVKLITIFDIAGKRVEVINRPAISNVMSMGGSLKPGVYVVEVHGANWLQSFKVVKMK